MADDMKDEPKTKEQLKAEGKAQDIIAAADKALKSFSLGGFFGGNASKFEDAMEAYDKAAAQYKIAKNWNAAAKCYAKVAEFAEKLKNEHEAASAYVNAAKCYKNSNEKDAVRMYKIAVELHMDNNRFPAAAKIYKEIAEIEEKQLDFPAATKAYQDAADCFTNEGSATSANQMLLKVAQLSATKGNYNRAIEIYQKVAVASLENNLLKWSVKDYLFKSGLCHLVLGAKAGDVSGVEKAIDKYKDMHPAFDGTRECKLLEDLHDAFNKDDVELYTGHVFKFDSIMKLDNWTASMLLQVKDIMKNGVGGGAGDGAGDEPDLT